MVHFVRKSIGTHSHGLRLLGDVFLAASNQKIIRFAAGRSVKQSMGLKPQPMDAFEEIAARNLQRSNFPAQCASMMYRHGQFPVCK